MIVQAVSAETSEIPAAADVAATAVPLFDDDDIIMVAVVPAVDVRAIDGAGGRTLSIPPLRCPVVALFPVPVDDDAACCLFLLRIRFLAVTKMRQ